MVEKKDDMAAASTFMPVVAAAIEDSEGRLLLQQGLPGKPHEGLWEFPGGKVDPGEAPREALAREIAEELGITLDPEAMIPVAFVDGPAPGRHPALVLLLYGCKLWSGVPQALEGQGWGWFTPAEAHAMPLAPLDRELLVAFICKEQA